MPANGDAVWTAVSGYADAVWTAVSGYADAVWTAVSGYADGPPPPSGDGGPW